MTAAAASPAIAPEIDLSAALAELAEGQRQHLRDLAELRRILEPPAPAPAVTIQRCDWETIVHRGGTGEWDECYPCRELGTIHNRRAVMNVCPGHHCQLDREIDAGQREFSPDYDGPIFFKEPML